jgi:hypothetical protein
MDHEVMQVDYQPLLDSCNGWTLGCLRIMEKFAASMIRAKHWGRASEVRLDSGI